MNLSLEVALYVATALFCVGVYGVLARQNVIVILMSLELMLNAVNLALVAFGRAFVGTSVEGDLHPSTSHSLVLLVLAVAAAEAAVGLSILLAVYRRWRSTDAGEMHLLKG